MELLKQLREISGAGMVDCKNALAEANNDLQTAVEILRKKGISKAAKRSARETKEGIVKVATSQASDQAYIFELNCETDFVARNEKFQALAEQIMDLVKQHQPADLNALLSLNLDNLPLSDYLANFSGTVGEKMEVKRFSSLSGATVAAYSHLGGRLGVVVALSAPGQEELAAEVAMQIAAANPKYIAPAEVDPAEMAKEKEIYREQLIKEGKPENMVDKIVEGKMSKYYAEVCLLEQEYIKDEKKKIKEILGANQVLGFQRFSL